MLFYLNEVSIGTAVLILRSCTLVTGMEELEMTRTASSLVRSLLTSTSTTLVRVQSEVTSEAVAMVCACSESSSSLLTMANWSAVVMVTQMMVLTQPPIGESFQSLTYNSVNVR